MVPGEAQLDWPVDRSLLNRGAIFAFAPTEGNVSHTVPHVPGRDAHGQQRVHGPDDREPGGVRAAEREVVVGQPVDARVKTCLACGTGESRLTG